MIKIGLLGLGNAGGQVAALAAATAGFDAVALNTSEKDLKTVEDRIPALVLGDEKGAGKDRATSKEFLRARIHDVLSSEEILNLVEDKDVVFLITSTGGGSGSGATPALQNVLTHKFPGIRFIIIHILPMLEESLAEQQNSIEFLTEQMRDDEISYLSYDNGSKNGTETKTEAMNKINHRIVEDLKVLRMDYQALTPYASMDEKDMMRILNTPGRIVVGHVAGFKEKEIDQKDVVSRLIDDLKSAGHTELEGDRSVLRTGIIYNLNEKLYKGVQLEQLNEFIGTAVEGFEHISLDEGENSVSLIASGLSFPDDRTEKIAQRIEELKAAITKAKGSRILGQVETDELKALRLQDNKKVEEASKQDIDNLMDAYF